MRKYYYNFMAALFAIVLTLSGCNPLDPTEEIQKVTFSPDGGDVEINTEVTLSCSTSGAIIYYSTSSSFNSSNYSTKGTKGTSVVLENEGKITLYALAVDSKGNTSNRSKAVFTVSPKAAENTALYLGNPSNAVTDINYPENYLMEKSTYALSYNNTTHNPNWVSWHLNSSNLGTVGRSDQGRIGFHEDTDLPEGWYRVTTEDYKNCGFTRGHMCPSGNRTSTEDENDEVFLMTNMVPQTANNNNTVWNGLEDQELEWVNNGKEIYIICGPYGKDGTYAYMSGSTNFQTKYDSTIYGNTSHKEYIPVSNVNNPSDPGIVVPASTWRVEIILDTDSTDDMNRITSSTTVIAINVPNTYECLYTSSGTKKTWEDYITTIDAIEEMTGYDFFALLPDDVEDVIEAKRYTK